MTSHRPYKDIFKRETDFRIKYRFYLPDEGGRYMLPYQGIRSDFFYEHNEHKKGMRFMIYPEFEDETGEVILTKDSTVPQTGTARMWILSEDWISYHKGKIGIGTIGYFMEGAKKNRAMRSHRTH